MAMNGSRNSSSAAQLLAGKAARTAGVISMVLALLGIAAVVAYLVLAEGLSETLTAMAIVKIALLVLVAGAGAQLILGRAWAQRFLLVVWLAGLVGAVAMAVGVALWGTPDWWNLQPLLIGPLSDLNAGAAVLMALAAAAAVQAAAVAALVRASAAGSRMRYATYVAITIAAAVALMVVVNMFSQATYLRRDVQSFQRFALSQRTKKILDAVDQPVRLTCVYTSTEDKDQTLTRRERVMELLQEMCEYNDKIEVENITTDTGKARLVQRLRGQLEEKAGKHHEFLARFERTCPQITQSLDELHQSWQAVVGQSYLDLWGLAAEVSRLLKTGTQEIEKASARVSNQLASTGLPNYGDLVRQVKDQLSVASKTLSAISERMSQIAAIAPAVAANRKAAGQSAAEALAAAKEMAKVVGEVGDPPPEDPGAVLERFSAAAEAAAKRAQAAAVAVDRIAGEQNVDLVRASQAWLVRTGAERRLVLPDGSVVMLERNTVTDLYTSTSASIIKLRAKIDTVRKAAKPEYQVQVVESLRQTAAALVQSLAGARQAAEAAFDALVKIDEPTKALLEGAASGKAFEAVTQAVEKMLESIDQLPELPKDTSAADITGEDIVIVETGGKREILDFESVWPLKERPSGMTDAALYQKRVFNGDSAVSSKILAMTHEPFATVLITYYKPETSREMERMMQRAALSPDKLDVLSDRLKEANFQVEQWNLKDPMPAPEDPERPQVLLVLPPAEIPPMGIRGQDPPAPFGEEHVEKIRQAVNAGTAALFLARFEPPRQLGFFMPPVSPPFLLGDYLQNDWGIHVRTDYFVMPTIPDETQPGKLKVDLQRFQYMPVSTFTDHPIGRYLQGQRVLWRDMALVQAESPPEGVTVRKLLSVPESWSNTWATRRLDELAAQFRTEEGSFISPDYAAGDLPVPLDVAVAATRAGGEQAQPSRIVVLGLAAGLTDGYLDQRVASLNPDGSLTLSDPPRANADVVINSLYWLVGLERYIARGPAQIKPVAMIPAAVMWTLKLTYLAGLPAAVLVLGAVVLLVRRR